MFLKDAKWLFIRRGMPDSIGIASVDQYHQKFNPLFEVQYLTPTAIFDISKLNSDQILKVVMEFYTQLVETKQFFPGRYGDWIKLSEIRTEQQVILNIDAIGQAAWNKASQAADLGIFVKNAKSVFFVGIIRGNDPGKGLPAIIGGIMNCDTYLDSAAYTILKEVEEEAGLRITYQEDLETLRQDYIIKSIPVEVHGFDQLDPLLTSIPAQIHYISTVPTPEQERNADGKKRVYVVTIYALMIDLGTTVLSEALLRKIFHAGDDAQELYIVDVTPLFSSSQPDTNVVYPPFGLHHHPAIFKEMVHFLRQKYCV